MNFSKNGANIIACVRSESIDFSDFILEITKTYGNKIDIIHFDLGIEEEIDKAFIKIKHLSNIDILVNNAGINQMRFFK